MNLPDKRQAERFRCQIPILVKQGHGVTRDFSIEGVYFVTDQSLALGEQLDFTLHLNHADPVWPIRLSCRGEVIRLEPGVEKTGVAVLITSHRLEGAPGFG